MSWCVIYTNPGQEFLAISELKKLNFCIYIPLVKKVVRHARKIKEAVRPFFPRYFFINLNISAEKWKIINYTKGVSKILTSEELPISISSTVISELKNLENDKGYINYDNLYHYKQGEKIEILAGPLKGKTGYYDALSDNQKAKILLDFMGRTLKINIYNNVINKV
jgi:transcriptional antiterminator RfaH